MDPALRSSQWQEPAHLESSAADLMQHLLRADRYERRALSRRKSAIRSFSETIKKPG
jgi:hypothetical protein